MSLKTEQHVMRPAFVGQGLVKATQILVTDHTALLLLALAGTLFHILFDDQYGFHRDELDFIMNVKNEETTHHTGLYVGREPRRPWNEMWQDMQWFQ